MHWKAITLPAGVGADAPIPVRLSVAAAESKGQQPTAQYRSVSKNLNPAAGRAGRPVYPSNSGMRITRGMFPQ